MDLETEDVLDEIIIVGMRYGDLADDVMTLYNGEREVDKDCIRRVVGDVVYLTPEPNKYDPYAIGVYTENQKRLGYVWMYQSHVLRSWFDDEQRHYLKAHLTGLNTEAKVMTAQADDDLQMPLKERFDVAIDMRWAENVPEVLTSITEQSLDLGLSLLVDELETATEWNERLKMRIDNLLRCLPTDLSANRYLDSHKLYLSMKHSQIKEVRHQSDILLQAFIWRGSKEQMKWWVEQWLPDFFREAADSDLLDIYETDLYTLERVEELLRTAPHHLFHLYKANRFRFANHLYYSSLPQPIYNRLLTLLAVREAMLAKGHAHRNDDEGIGKKMKLAIGYLKEEEVLKHLYDYTWIYEVMNSTKDMPHYNSPASFISHLKQMGIKSLPSEDSINKKQNVTLGTFSDWQFTDCDAKETIRRVNVGKRFLNVYRNL